MKLFAAVILVICSCFTLEAQQAKKIKIVDLEKTIDETNTPLVINFWATFCKPCLEELPYFQKLPGKYGKEGLTVLLVSLDMKDAYPAKVNSYIKKQKITIPTAWLDETNADYFCPKVDESWSGAIPATLFINKQAGYRKFTEEQLTEAELEMEIKAVLGKN